MKHVEVRQKYSAARCIFNSLVLRLMLDIQDYLTYVLQDNCKWSDGRHQNKVVFFAPLHLEACSQATLMLKSKAGRSSWVKQNFLNDLTVW